MKNYTDEQCQQAAEWFLIIRDEQEPAAETLLEWTRWLNASDSNRRAFEEIEQAYHLTVPSLTVPPVLGQAGQPRDGKRDDGYDGSVSVAEWLARKEPAAPRWKWAVAAAAVLAVGLSSWFVYRVSDSLLPAETGIYVTRTGEHLGLRLEDGSRVTLGARSTLRVAFDDGTRRIKLDAGEAFFDVHKDPHRPFVVEALNGVITAVGTAFNVRATADRVTVAVTHGVVRVTDRSDAQNASGGGIDRPEAGVSLSLGEQISFTTEQPIARSRTAVVTAEEATRWRDGWLVYRNEPLRYVIADVARYSDLRISFDDAAGEQLRFTGAVFKNDVDEWLMALPKVFPLDIKANGSGFTIGAPEQTNAAKKD